MDMNQDKGTSLDNYIGFLQYLASTIERLNGVPVIRAVCPECGGHWSVWKSICPSSRDYECGYRAIWKCENEACGEMELR
jgi:hypothetical protein